MNGTITLKEKFCSQLCQPGTLLTKFVLPLWSDEFSLVYWRCHWSVAYWLGYASVHRGVQLLLWAVPLFFPTAIFFLLFFFLFLQFNFFLKKNFLYVLVPCSEKTHLNYQHFFFSPAVRKSGQQPEVSSAYFRRGQKRGCAVCRHHHSPVRGHRSCGGNTPAPGGDLLWWVKGGVLLLVWETYYGERKEVYCYGCGRLTMVSEGRCITMDGGRLTMVREGGYVIMGDGDLLWWRKGDILLVVEVYYSEWREMYYYGRGRLTIVSKQCIILWVGDLLWWREGDVLLQVVETSVVSEGRWWRLPIGDGKEMYYYGWWRFTMVKEGRCIIMGGGDLLRWVKGDVLFWVV